MYVASLFTCESRALFVAAHPDDETLMSGGLMATLADRGVDVSLICATRGEQGSIFGETGDVSSVRVSEIGCAAQALGVRRFCFLGEGFAKRANLPDRFYEDSGLQDAPSHTGRTLLSSFLEAVDDLMHAITELRPQIVVTHNQYGGYGHRDHVAVHNAVRRAVRNVANADMSLWVASTEPYGGQSDGQPDFVCDSMFLVKLAALRCYKSQFRILHTNSKRAKIQVVSGEGYSVPDLEAYRCIA